jgi:hypothetical protein
MKHDNQPTFSLSTTSTDKAPEAHGGPRWAAWITQHNIYRIAGPRPCLCRRQQPTREGRHAPHDSFLVESVFCVCCVSISTPRKTDTRLRNRGRHIHTSMNDMNMKDTAANKEDGLSNDMQQQRSLDEYLEIAYDSVVYVHIHTSQNRHAPTISGPSYPH